MSIENDANSIDRFFRFLSTKDIHRNTDYLRIPELIVSRLEAQFSLEAVVFVPNLGTPKYYSEFSALIPGSRLHNETDYLAAYAAYANDPEWCAVEINLSELDEVELLDPRLTLLLRDKSSSLSRAAAGTIGNLVKDFILRCVQRQRATIRRDVIMARIGSSDLSSFLYRVVRESLLKRLDCEVCSVFVFDPTTSQLQLRQTTGLIDSEGNRTSLRNDAASWVNTTFRSQRPLFEFAATGNLRLGATAERTANDYWNRIYWPIQIQFKHLNATSRHVRRQCSGVLRLGNLGHSWRQERHPVTLFEVFLVEFYCECMFNVIEFFTDKRVEGFERDTAFHTAASVAHGCLKNIALARGLLFGNVSTDSFLGHQYPIQKQFELAPVSGAFQELEVCRALDNAFGYSLDLLSQIERANVTNRTTPSVKREARTEKLLANVIIVAVRMIPHFVSSHSVRSPVEINKIFGEQWPPVVLGDATDLLSVFANIFENAIKYGRQDAPIKLHVAIADESSFVRIDISDNGIGIDPDDEHRIFTHGYRGSRAKRHSMRGSGYGLAYCREILKQSQGEISAHFREEGLTISIRLRKG